MLTKGVRVRTLMNELKSVVSALLDASSCKEQRTCREVAYTRGALMGHMT